MQFHGSRGLGYGGNAAEGVGRRSGAEAGGAQRTPAGRPRRRRRSQGFYRGLQGFIGVYRVL